MLTRYFTILLFLLIGRANVWAQPPNDNCENARELCKDELVSGTTIGATVEQCFNSNPNGCADDNSPCYVPYATVWYKFTTNTNGGAVTVEFTNLSINPDPTLGKKLHAVMLRSDNPCEGGNYNYVSQCQNNGLVAFSLTSTVALAPNTTYYIQVDGSGVGPGVTQPAKIDFDIKITGPGVDVLPMSVDISTDDSVICQFDQVPIDIAFTNCTGEPSFEWYYNGVLRGNEAIFQTNSLTESGYLFLKSSCGTAGCPNTAFSDSIYFDVTPIEANAGPDILVEIGEEANISGSGVGTPSWTPTDYLINDNTFTPTANVDETTIFFLTVTNGDCILTDEMSVLIKNPINIPSGFTPNGDGNNDFWEIEFLDQYQDNQVIIYDRSGQIVYKTVGYNNGTTVWDGTFKEKPAPASTYFYFIDLRNGKDNSIFRGPVTVIR